MNQTKNHAKTEYREIADLTEAERHRLLTAERRRILLTILSTHSPPMQFDTVAEKIADQDSDVETVDREFVERIKAILHHTHFPMMADMGMLEYDSETNRIDFAESWSY